MRLGPFAAIFLLMLAAVRGEQLAPEAVKDAKDKAEKMMAAQRASELQDADWAFGREVMGTLGSLMPVDPDLARRFFLKARVQVEADRKAGTVSREAELAAGEDTKNRKRSASVLSAALGAALKEVENYVPNGDERLPAIIAATAALQTSGEGCALESCRSMGTHLGNLVNRAGIAPGNNGVFSVQRLVEQTGPVIKEEWLPALFDVARGVMWVNNIRNNEEAQKWLEKEAKEGAHRGWAMLLLTGARVGSQESSTANKARAGIMVRDQLPSEQQWLITLLEKKSVPPAIAASAAAEMIRDWPAAEPPLRYACGRALATAWAADAPVNESEAGQILDSLLQLGVNHVLPDDEGMKAIVEELVSAGLGCIERSRALYGWPAPDFATTAGPRLLRLAVDGKRDDLTQKGMTLLKREVAKDENLTASVRISEQLQAVRLHALAQQLIESFPDEQLKSEKVSSDLRNHIGIKRVHITIQAAAAAGGLDAAVKATVDVLNAKSAEPSSWFGAAWAWHNMGGEFRADGNVEEGLRRHCIAVILAHAADRFAGNTFGHYAPPAENACRSELTALRYDPDKVDVFRSIPGVTAMLAEFGNGWKPLSPAAESRILAGVFGD